MSQRQILLQKQPKYLPSFWDTLKSVTLVLSKNCFDHFLSTFGLKIDYFLFQHLVSLFEPIPRFELFQFEHISSLLRCDIYSPKNDNIDDLNHQSNISCALSRASFLSDKNFFVCRTRWLNVCFKGTEHFSYFCSKCHQINLSSRDLTKISLNLVWVLAA